MNDSNFCKSESGSRRSTEEDSGSEGDNENFYVRTNPAKHKTELCKTYSELGYCPYEHKCRFAHGRQELVGRPVKQPLKSRRCNGFWKNGCCSYGIRCQFGHAELDWQNGAILLGLEAFCKGQRPRISKLLKMLNWMIFISLFLQLDSWSNPQHFSWLLLSLFFAGGSAPNRACEGEMAVCYFSNFKENIKLLPAKKLNNQDTCTLAAIPSGMLKSELC